MQTKSLNASSSVSKTGREALLGRLGKSKQDVWGTPPTNQFGGIELSEEEYHYAGKFFSEGSISNGKGIRKRDFIKQLQKLKIDVPDEAISEMFHNRDFISFKDLHDLLDENTFKEVDPFVETFQIMDRNLSGFVTSDSLRHVMQPFFDDQLPSH